jgi:dCMP deaminase
MMERPDWDEYFMEIGRVVATRATCARKHVGAVVTSASRQILSTGYNGSPPGAPHCDDEGHELVDGHCVRTVHAEANAIAQAAKNGVSLYGGILYTTASPCYDCGKFAVNAGIKKVVFDEQYDSRYGMSGQVSAFLLACGVTISGFKSTWTRDGEPDVEKAVAAERERLATALKTAIDLTARSENGLKFLEKKLLDILSSR